MQKEAQILAYSQSLTLVHTDVLRRKLRELLALWAEYRGLSPVHPSIIKQEIRIAKMPRKLLKKQLLKHFTQTL